VGITKIAFQWAFENCSFLLIFLKAFCCAQWEFFGKFGLMRALVIKPKNDTEYKFLSSLLKKLGINSSSVSLQELEDVGLSKLMKGIDKSQKASRAEIMKKLSA
jgi:hypothetical protein